MGRIPCCDMMGVKKGPWTLEEDRKLVDYIEKHGFGNWRALPKQAGVMRCGKSCRLRWMNYLRPDIKRGSLSPEEEQTIIQLHAILGNKWSTIASYLPGRTDNEIKNIWNTHLKKRLMQSDSGKNPVRHRPANSSCFSTVPATGAVNNSLLKSPTMDISHLDHDFQLLSSYSPDDNGGLQRIENNFDANNFVQVSDQGPPFADANEKFVSRNPGSSILSSLKDSEGQIEHSGAEYSTGEDIIDDQQFVSNTLWETCNADHRQTDENRSAHDYINFLKKFLDIDEESSVISPYELHQDANATFTIERHHFDNEKRTLQPYKCLSLEVHRSEDHITPGVFCWSSPFSVNQSDYEIQTSFADSQASYSYSPNSSSSNSLHVITAPMTLSADFLVGLPEKLWQAF